MPFSSHSSAPHCFYHASALRNAGRAGLSSEATISFNINEILAASRRPITKEKSGGFGAWKSSAEELDGQDRPGSVCMWRPSGEMRLVKYPYTPSLTSGLTSPTSRRLGEIDGEC